MTFEQQNRSFADGQGGYALIRPAARATFPRFRGKTSFAESSFRIDANIYDCSVYVCSIKQRNAEKPSPEIGGRPLWGGSLSELMQASMIAVYLFAQSSRGTRKSLPPISGEGLFCGISFRIDASTYDCSVFVCSTKQRNAKKPSPEIGGL